jgi:3-oxoacyl-[acyl-carrier protein] reductase
MDLRIALVTGAASGIGLATSRRLAAQGLRVVLLDRSDSVHASTSALVSQGLSAVALQADLHDPVQLRRAADWVKAEEGGCDVLVNNAGIHPKRDGVITAFEDASLEEWEQVLRINLTAPFLLCQKLIAGMKARRWGRIINVASRAGRTWSGLAGAHYVASKAGLIGLTRKLAGDYAAFGITANCVAPGQIETPMALASSKTVLASGARTTPAGRMGTVDEVASAIHYLASDDAGFVNGAVLDINGGGFIG